MTGVQKPYLKTLSYEAREELGKPTKAKFSKELKYHSKDVRVKLAYVNKAASLANLIP
jgi:hypothetical protein